MRNANTVSIAIFAVLFLFVEGCGAQPTTDPAVLEATITAKVIATISAGSSKPTVAPIASVAPTVSSDPTGKIPARATYSGIYDVSEVYDKFKDQTNVTLNPLIGYVSAIPQQILWSYTYPGTKPAIPALVSASFITTSKDWQWLSISSVDWLLDDTTRFSLKATREGKVQTGSVAEFVTVILTVDQFLQIANAQKVEAKLINTQVQLQVTQMDALRSFASRMRP